jgi:hypothetical protein
MPYAWETKPSAEARRTGYRTDSARHQVARAKVPKRRRVQIARLGGRARAAGRGQGGREEDG